MVMGEEGRVFVSSGVLSPSRNETPSASVCRLRLRRLNVLPNKLPALAALKKDHYCISKSSRGKQITSSSNKT